MKKAARLIEHDGGVAASGLRRIRRAPSYRSPGLLGEEDAFVPATLQKMATLPISGASSRSASRSRVASRSASIHQAFVSGPVSPVFEDLQRFPAESLHSFSFARQSEDFLHSRQAIIEKSVDFIRSHKTLKNNAGLAQAQAKVSGDVQIQGVMDLLKRAKVMPSLDVNAANGSVGLGLGPLTGPAHFDGRNIFERSFGMGLEDTKEESEPEESSGEASRSSKPELTVEIPEEAIDSGMASPEPARMPTLRRTLTDVNILSLQQKLLDTLAQPYSSTNAPLAQGSNAVSFLPGAIAPPASSVTGITTVHTPSSKWAPPPQAFFRTDADSPWTIVAANDLACLAFGVTRAEVRSLSILGLIQQDRRQWLEDRLRPPEEVKDPPRSPFTPTHGKTSSIGSKGGITARLLSKAPSRTVKNQRASTADGAQTAAGIYSQSNKNHIPRKSRGVLLCGEILPIQKRDGTIGAASFWVMEKRGGLIWVVEQVVEDVAYLEYDNARRLAGSDGDTENIWGEPLRSNTKLRYLIPKLSFEDLDDPSFDGEPVMGYYTASTMGGVNVPTCVAKVKGKQQLRISSLPNIAGVMVLQPGSLQISSSNSIFSQALFGYQHPNGTHVDDIIPHFSQILALLAEDDADFFVEGLVVPEHSFRRARALLTLRDGSEDAASLFLRPAGLVARHRDGSEILVDVQMRVVESETVFPAPPEDVIVEEGTEVSQPPRQLAVNETVYALWITYSRQLHSAGMGVARPEHPLLSRPATPPAQPPPPDVLPSPPPTVELQRNMDIPASVPHSRDLSPAEPLEHPPPHIAQIAHRRKVITDFVILEDMGSGAYGEVKLARYNTSRNSKVVIKYVTKKKILVDTWIRDRRLGTTPLEIHVLDFLRREGYQHPNIVEMVDFFEDDINYYIEMLPHGLPGMDLFVSTSTPATDMLTVIGLHRTPYGHART